MSALLSILISSVMSLAALMTAFSTGSANTTAVMMLAVAMFFFLYSTLSSVGRPGGLLLVVNGLYYVVFLAFPGMLHAAGNQYPFYNLIYPESEVTSSALLLLLFSIAIVAGQSMGYVRPFIQSTEDGATTTATVARPLTILGLVGLSALLVVAIGPGLFLAKRSDDVLSTLEVGSELSALLTQAARTFAILAFIASLHRCIYMGRSFSNISLALVTLALNAVANFPLGIPRFNLFCYLLIIMHLVVDVTRPRFKGLFAVGVIAGTGTIFPLTSFLQRGQEGTSFEFDFLGYFKTSGDLDGFQSMVNATLLVAREGFSWGWQLLSALLTFVPRAVWPSKGVPTGSVAAEAAGYLFLNISMPLPSEFFVDFGLAGGVVGGMIVGYVLSRLDTQNHSFSAMRSLWATLFIGGTCGYLVILSRGTLIGVIAPIGLYFVCSFLITRSAFSEKVERKQTSGSTKPVMRSATEMRLARTRGIR